MALPWEFLRKGQTMAKTKTKPKTNAKLQPDLIPGILLFAFLPVVVKGQLVNVTLGKFSWFQSGEYQYDFFMYAKSIVFLILAAYMLLVVLDRLLIRNKPPAKSRIFLPLFIYGAFVILSTLFSVDKTLSLKGMWQQNESVWVLLGYIVAVYYFYQVTEGMQDVRIFLTAFGIGAVWQGILGFFQFIGKDLFATAPGRKLLTLGLDGTTGKQLNFLTQGSSESVYLASYTANYAAVYLLMALPVVLLLAWLAKKTLVRVLWLLLGAVLLLCLYGSGSKTAIGGAVVLILTAFLIFIRDRKKRILAVGICAVGIAAGLVVYGNVRGGIFPQKETYALQDLIPGEDGVTLKFNDKTYELCPVSSDEGDSLTIYDEDRNRIPAYWDMDQQCFVAQDDALKELKFDSYMDSGTQNLLMQYQDITWEFVKANGSPQFVYINFYKRGDEIRTADSVLKGYEKLFTGRGYIWGRAIPLLKEHILVGSGPDTFVEEFPQQDYVMKANTGRWMLEQIPSKAHSLYLQSALQTGILSLLCLLIFWGSYAVSSVRSLKQKKDSSFFAVDAVILLSVTAFLFMGLMNDSNLAVSPLFWGMLGLGCAMKKTDFSR